GTLSENCDNSGVGFVVSVATDAGPATDSCLAGVEALALSPSGELLIADNWHNRIRALDSSGMIRTIAGNGLPSEGIAPGLPKRPACPAEGPALAVCLEGPTGLAIAPDG